MYKRQILGSGILIASLSIIGLLYLKVDVNIASFFRQGTEFRNSIDFIDKEMTGTMDIRVRVEGSMKDPKILSEIENLQNMLEASEKITTSYSVADVVKQMHRVVMDDDPAFESIPKERGKVNNLFSMYSMSGDPEDFSSLVDYEYRVGLVTALSRVMSTEEIFSIVEKIEKYVNEMVNTSNNVKTRIMTTKEAVANVMVPNSQGTTRILTLSLSISGRDLF